VLSGEMSSVMFNVRKNCLEVSHEKIHGT
jgi:hypothetical protein